MNRYLELDVVARAAEDMGVSLPEAEDMVSRALDSAEEREDSE